MSSDARLRMEGLLQEKEQQARHLAIRMHGLKKQLREQTDQHRPIGELDVSVVRAAVDDLTTSNQAYEALLKEIAALREDLGLPRYEPR